VPKDTIDPLLVAVGMRIRKLREAWSMSQSELARRAQVDRAYLVGIEQGKRNITIRHLARLARALKTTPGSLLDG
jgi:transcriptional regulator with XRE-family HTH domain